MLVVCISTDLILSVQWCQVAAAFRVAMLGYLWLHRCTGTFPKLNSIGDELIVLSSALVKNGIVYTVTSNNILKPF